MKFHYPSEHALNGTFHDLEMHIKFSDVDNMHSQCRSGIAVLAIFFNKTEGADPGSFFNFTTGESALSVDFSELIPTVAGMTDTFTGYKASDTVPPCTPDVCWYIQEKVYKITED